MFIYELTGSRFHYESICLNIRTALYISVEVAHVEINKEIYPVVTKAQAEGQAHRHDLHIRFSFLSL
jgi:hypothetical protein